LLVLALNWDHLALNITERDPLLSYHMREIKVRGVYGQPSKIAEELDELEEALEQGNRILALCELADLYGALQAVAEDLGSNITEIAKMAEATRRAFKSGARK
jgi:hypothetical protein